MTAITDTTLDSIPVAADISRTPSFARPMLVSALGEHALAWIDQVARFVAGALIALAILAGAGWPPLSFLAAFSAAGGLLYIANMADVERYRDGILFIVPTLFVWVVLSLGAGNAVLVGLTLFTQVFLNFVGAFARVTGTLRILRLWSLLLGFNLTLLIYLVGAFL